MAWDCQRCATPRQWSVERACLRCEASSGEGKHGAQQSSVATRNEVVHSHPYEQSGSNRFKGLAKSHHCEVVSSTSEILKAVQKWSWKKRWKPAPRSRKYPDLVNRLDKQRKPKTCQPLNKLLGVCSSVLYAEKTPFLNWRTREWKNQFWFTEKNPTPGKVVILPMLNTWKLVTNLKLESFGKVSLTKPPFGIGKILNNDKTRIEKYTFALGSFIFHFPVKSCGENCPSKQPSFKAFWKYTLKTRWAREPRAQTEHRRCHLKLNPICSSCHTTFLHQELLTPHGFLSLQPK